MSDAAAVHSSLQPQTRAVNAARALLIGIVVELCNLFSIAVTRGDLQLLPLSANRFWSFAGHAALLWLLLATREAVSGRAGRGPDLAYRIARLAVVALCLLGACRYFESGQRLSSDGPHYFVQARSLLFDHDLDFANDYTHVPAALAMAERYPVGMALLALPFLAVGHVLVLVVNLLGRAVPADGFGDSYETAFGLGSYLFGSLGLLAMLRATSRFFPVWLAMLSVTTIWASSFFVWYMVVEPSMPHAMSAAWTAFLVTFWLERRPFVRKGDWLGVGALAGVAALVRWQNGVLLTLPLVDHLLVSRVPWRNLCLAVIAALICFTPQMVFWHLKAHSPVALPLAEHGVHWSQLSIAEVLYSTNRGLFTWSPVAYLAVAGLILWLRRSGRLAALFLLGFLLQLYVNGSVAIWWSGWSFGSRRFENCLLFFAIGLAAALEFLRSRPLLPLLALCGFLVLWNIGLMGQSRTGEIPPDRLVSFEDVTARNVHLFYRAAGLPFAAPANWLFAWRYGVSPERFDRLFGHEPFGNFRADFGPDMDAFTGRGWSDAERDSQGRWFRWCASDACSFLLPLGPPRAYVVSVATRPAKGTAPNWLGLCVNGVRQMKRGLADEVTLSWGIPPSVVRKGINEFRFEFDRTARPADLGSSTDARRLAGAVYRVEVVVSGDAQER